MITYTLSPIMYLLYFVCKRFCKKMQHKSEQNAKTPNDSTKVDDRMLKQKANSSKILGTSGRSQCTMSAITRAASANYANVKRLLQPNNGIPNEEEVKNENKCEPTKFRKVRQK